MKINSFGDQKVGEKGEKEKMKDKSRKIWLSIAVFLIVASIYYLQDSKVSVKSSPSNTNAQIPTDSQTPLPISSESYLSIEQKEKMYQRTPELVGISGYINTDGEEIKISDYKGKVVLIDFWTYSCINCIRTLPYLVSWHEKYVGEGLVIIGVHTPEFKFEQEYDNVLNAVEKYDIEYAVVQDNDYATWTAFQNRFWPRKYLIDKDGFIRYDHIGEGKYEATERIIQQLLAEIGKDASSIELTREGNKLSLHERTPELYAGYEFALNRGQNIGNEGGLVIRTIHDYLLPEKFDEDKIYIEGSWKSNPDNLELVGDTGKIVLLFAGKEVNIVGESKSETAMKILIDGQESEIKIKNPDLYNVYSGEPTQAKLELIVQEGFSFNSFTFG